MICSSEVLLLKFISYCKLHATGAQSLSSSKVSLVYESMLTPCWCDCLYPTEPNATTEIRDEEITSTVNVITEIPTESSVVIESFREVSSKLSNEAKRDEAREDPHSYPLLFQKSVSLSVSYGIFLCLFGSQFPTTILVWEVYYSTRKRTSYFNLQSSYTSIKMTS